MKRSIIDSRTVLLAGLILTTLGVVLWLGLYERGLLRGGAGRVNDDSRIHRELAGRLRSAGLLEEAALQYEIALESPKNTNSSKANISYSIGNMYFEIGRYEKALSWFYRVELYEPESKIKKEADKKIVNCLERIGKSSAAEYALESRSGFKRNKEMDLAGDKVVARVGDDIITLRQVNEVYDKLPEFMREEFDGKEGRMKFANRYVAEELLYRKARKLGYDKDPEILKGVEELARALMIQKVLEDEIGGKIEIDPVDLKNYYEVNKEKYEEKDFEEVKERVRGDYYKDKFQSAYQRLLMDTLKVSRVEFHPEVFDENQ